MMSTGIRARTRSNVQAKARAEVSVIAGGCMSMPVWITHLSGALTVSIARHHHHHGRGSKIAEDSGDGD